MRNINYQNNISVMKLEINGKAHPGKRTRHFDIKFFYFTDLVKLGKIQVKYCLTNNKNCQLYDKTIGGNQVSGISEGDYEC